MVAGYQWCAPVIQLCRRLNSRRFLPVQAKKFVRHPSQLKRSGHDGMPVIPAMMGSIK
jgi:hypothetical protein